jgi:hypothetical protein
MAEPSNQDNNTRHFSGWWTVFAKIFFLVSIWGGVRSFNWPPLLHYDLSPPHHVPGPNEALLSAVDAELAKMPKAQMAFNTPPPMNIDDQPATVEVRINSRQTPSEIRRSITVPGATESHEIRISNEMRATIEGDGDGLKIMPQNSAIQAVSFQEPTVWRWSIKPLRQGTYPIHVALEAGVWLDGAITPRLINVFDGSITVTITPVQRVKHFVSDNWQWLGTALLLPAAGWWWKERKKKGEFTVS